MRRFVEGVDRGQRTLFPECLEDWIDEGNPVRAIDAFVEKLDLSGLGFDGVAPEATGRPSYHPSGLLKLWLRAVWPKFAFATRAASDGQATKTAWSHVWSTSGYGTCATSQDRGWTSAFGGRTVMRRTSPQ
jgi:hypothetical protein